MTAISYLKEEEIRLNGLLEKILKERDFIREELKALGISPATSTVEEQVDVRELFKVGEPVRINKELVKPSVYSKYPEVLKVVGYTHRTNAVLVKGEGQKEAVGFGYRVLEKVS